MLAQVATVVRGMLTRVVELGTARGPRSLPRRHHVAGGKTGTGITATSSTPRRRGGGVAGDERAATFVFMLDIRYFGTVTAYVPGPEAARFHFTSALPVRVTGLLMPALDGLSSPAPTPAAASASP